MSTTNVHIARTIRSHWNTADYPGIVRHILGPTYELSIVLVGDQTTRRLNLEHRNKHGVSNVLTFPLNETSGEVFLNVPKIKRESGRFGLSAAGHAKYLLIHACLHLKGYSHGSTMEQAEDRLVRRFNIR